MLRLKKIFDKFLLDFGEWKILVFLEEVDSAVELTGERWGHSEQHCQPRVARCPPGVFAACAWASFVSFLKFLHTLCLSGNTSALQCNVWIVWFRNQDTAMVYGIPSITCCPIRWLHTCWACLTHFLSFFHKTKNRSQGSSMVDSASLTSWNRSWWRWRVEMENISWKGSKGEAWGAHCPVSLLCLGGIAFQSRHLV